MFSYSRLYNTARVGACKPILIYPVLMSIIFEPINTNGKVDDFLKSLPSDNTILAELVCQNTSNETILKIYQN